MSWFFIALWAPFLLACANHNDKFLLSRYLKEKNIGSIVLLSSLFSAWRSRSYCSFSPTCTTSASFRDDETRGGTVGSEVAFAVGEEAKREFAVRKPAALAGVRPSICGPFGTT
jgi:hypothetical protein